MGWDGKRSTYVEAQHGASNGRPKVNGAMRRECAEPHGQFTRIDDFIARCCLNRHVDAIEAANTPELYWFWRGGTELYAGDQEETFLDRTKQSKVSGTPRAGSSFCSSTGGPTCFSLTIFKFNMDLGVTCDL